VVKTLSEIVGTLYQPKSPDEKKFVDLHKPSKFEFKAPGLDDDKLFRATNITPASMKRAVQAESITEGVELNEDLADTLQKIQPFLYKWQDAMSAMQRHGDIAQDHNFARDHHDQLASDMNQPEELRGLHDQLAGNHSVLAAQHDDLKDTYAKLGQYHQGMVNKLSGGK
jgi:hypothetical protein